MIPASHARFWIIGVSFLILGVFLYQDQASARQNPYPLDLCAVTADPSINELRLMTYPNTQQQELRLHRPQPSSHLCGRLQAKFYPELSNSMLVIYDGKPEVLRLEIPTLDLNGEQRMVQIHPQGSGRFSFNVALEYQDLPTIVLRRRRE